MKLKNILTSILLLLVTIFTFSTVEAASVAPSSFKVNGSDFKLLDGSKYLQGGNLHFYYKKNTDGKIIYCMERTKDPIGKGVVETYTLSKELEAKYAYVLLNGYPNKSITGDDEKDYFITGLALWYLQNPNDEIFRNFEISKGQYRGKTSDIARGIAVLTLPANGYKYIEPSIELFTNDAPNLKFTLTTNGRYYESSNIGVVTEGTVGKYTVSLTNAPAGTIILDKNGNQRNTFAINEDFKIRVPESLVGSSRTTFKINVTAEGTIYKAYLYNPTNKKYQTTSALYPVTKDVNDSKNVTITPKTTPTPPTPTIKTADVPISKQDATTSKELEGAHLELRDSKGTLIEAWVSTKEAHIVKGLEPGTYTLTETLAPTGYELSKETVTFTVKEDGTVDKKVIMYNKPETIVPVPSTSSFKTITTSLIGIITIGLGSVVIYRNYKKNEEK